MTLMINSIMIILSMLIGFFLGQKSVKLETPKTPRPTPIKVPKLSKKEKKEQAERLENLKKKIETINNYQG